MMRRRGYLFLVPWQQQQVLQDWLQDHKVQSEQKECDGLDPYQVYWTYGKPGLEILVQLVQPPDPSFKLINGQRMFNSLVSQKLKFLKQKKEQNGIKNRNSRIYIKNWNKREEQFRDWNQKIIKTIKIEKWSTRQHNQKIEDYREGRCRTTAAEE